MSEVYGVYSEFYGFQKEGIIRQLTYPLFSKKEEADKRKEHLDYLSIANGLMTDYKVEPIHVCVDYDEEAYDMYRTDEAKELEIPICKPPAERLEAFISRMKADYHIPEDELSILEDIMDDAKIDALEEHRKFNNDGEGW